MRRRVIRFAVDAHEAPNTRYAERWFAAVHPAVGGAVHRVAWLVATFALLLARTPRGAWGASFVLWVLGAGVAVLAASRRSASLKAVLLRWYEPWARNGVARDLRDRLRGAEVLAHGDLAAGESRSLARLHLARLVEAVDWVTFDRRADRVCQNLRRVSRALLVVIVAIVVVRGEAMLEGLAVLTARGRIARFAIPYAQGPRLTVRPPAYLRLAESTVPFEGTVVLHAGSDVELRLGVRREGLEPVVLVGGERLATTSDGRGEFVLRRGVSGDTTWTIGRVVGDVFVADGATIELQTAHDALPVVELEGAPKQALLGETDREGGVPVSYVAEDDHGLREVHLVLRSGAVEERRPLATLDGERRTDRGASFVRTADPFFRKALGPVEIRVEARDDGREGARWGRSEAIVVVPPAIGTAEAERFKSLVLLRDHEVDRLARRLTAVNETGPATLSALLVDLEEEREEIEASLATSSLGLVVPGNVRTAVRRESVRLGTLLETLPQRDGSVARAEVVAATEGIVLGLDGALRGVAWGDARAVARRIGQQVQVAGDAITASVPVTLGDDLARLASAASTLRVLGPLGRDLGDLTEGELARVRGILASDAAGTKVLLGALARRLARPDPSFGARGASGKGGTGDGRHELGSDSGGEGSGGETSGEGETSERGQAPARGSAVDDLAKEQQGLRRAADGLSHAPLEDAAGERAAHARELQELAGSDELRHREGEMRLRRAAEDVRRGDFRSAREAVRSAARMVPRASSREKSAVRSRLEDEAAWIDDKLLGDAKLLADEQKKLANRAESLGKSARDERVSKALGESSSAMDRAERAFREGHIDRAIAAQGDSLDSLEVAREALRTEEGRSGDDGAHAGVPRSEEERAAAWRKRVIDGLAGRAKSRDPDAVQRYEEGLLR